MTTRPEDIKEAPKVYVVREGENDDFIPGNLYWNVLRRDDNGKLKLVVSLHDEEAAEDFAFMLNEAREGRMARL